jgi:MFS family permease
VLFRSEPAVRTRLRLGRVPASLRGRLLLLALMSGGIAFVSGPVNGLLFVYAERIVHLRPATTGLAVLAAGPIGLAGLLAGRWIADHLGRRIDAAGGQAVMAIAGMLTYRGGGAAAIGGYLVTIFAGGVLSPAAGALAAELFPTSSRATAAGWLTVSGVLGAVTGLVCFGTLADRTGFSSAALAICLPVALLSPLWFRLPETRGLELEESAPEPEAGPEPAAEGIS